jgi:hypothetical protein
MCWAAKFSIISNQAIEGYTLSGYVPPRLCSSSPVSATAICHNWFDSFTANLPYLVCTWLTTDALHMVWQTGRWVSRELHTFSSTVTCGGLRAQSLFFQLHAHTLLSSGSGI